MSDKISHAAIEKNKNIWTKNLVKFQESHKRRRLIPLEQSSLEEINRMPLQTQIVERYLHLGTEIKGRKGKIVEISKEVTKLGKNKLNFSCVSVQVIQTKIQKVLNTYDECVKRGKYDALNDLFDVTKISGLWLSTEDKQLYHLQVESKGEVGYSTGQLASKETIHPSKRRKTDQASASTSYHIPSSDNGTDSVCSEYSDEDDRSPPRTTRKYSKSKIATKLVTSTGVSTSKAAKICKQLSDDGVDIQTPSQAAIYKSTFREAAKLKEEMIQTLQMEQWSIHFDGKHIDKHE
ncbi:MAG: hypothetical protein P8X78_01585 [Nitrosopumilaceae archaeon]